MSAIPDPPLDGENLPPKTPVHHGCWGRALAGVIGGIAFFILLAVVGVIVLLHSARFHAYLLHTARQKASAALGSQVQVQDFELHWSGTSPTLDLYGVVVQGAMPPPTPPLLRVDRVLAQVQVTSVLNRTWYINDIVVDRPVAQLIVDKNGQNNIPSPRSSGSKSNANIFDLGIRHARLTNGEVYLNDRKASLDADLHDLTLRSAFNAGKKSYSGTLSYRDGHLKYGAYQSIPHNLHAKFTATPEQLTLSDAVLSARQSEVVLNATLKDYSNPQLQAQYQATVDAGQFRSILNNPSIPGGIFRTHGAVQYAPTPGESALQSAKLTGEISSPSLSVRSSKFNGSILDFSARYTLVNGNAYLHNMTARVFGGELTGSVTMKDLAGATHSHLQADLHGVSLADLRPMLNSTALQNANVGGIVNATVSADWGKTLSDLVAHATASLQGQIAPTNSAAPPVPVTAKINGNYSAATGKVTLSNSYLKTASASLDLNGTLSTQSRLQIHLDSADLHQLESMAAMFRVPTPGQPSQPLGLSGTGSFNGYVSGSAGAPHLVGQLTFNNLRFRGTAWRLIRTDVNAGPSQAQLQNGVMQPADHGRINFALTAGLNKWSFAPDSPVSVRLNGSQLNVADMARAAGLQTPVSGTLNVNLALHGTQLSPVGQGTIAISRAKISNQPIQALNLKFHGNGDQVLGTLGVKIPAGSANANFTVDPKQKSYDAQLRADGIRLDQLTALKQRGIQLAGVLNLEANGRGTFQNPELQLTAVIPELKVRDQKISNLKLQAAMANHVANVALDSQVINTSIHGRGTVNLTGDYYTTATLDSQSIPLGPLVDVYAPSQAGNVTGQTELHATLKGPLKNKSQIDAHVVIPELKVDYKNIIQLGAVGPIHADFVNGVLQLQRSEIRGTDTDLQFQGTIPVTSKAPASLLLLGNIDLRLAQLYDPSIAGSGQLRFNINSYGRTTNPNVEGRVDVVNANFAGESLPVGLQNGNGVLTLTNDRLNITQFTGKVGSGTVTVSGGVVYRPSLQFDLALKGNGIRVLLPQGVRTGVDTELALTGNTQAALLSGQVRIDQLSFTPDFDLMSFAGQLGGATMLPPTQGFSQALQLNIALQSTTNINLVSRTLSVQGAANLNIRGTAAQPVILGRVNLSGGDLIFGGNRYVMQGGTIEFVDPSRANPIVNVGMNTTIQQYNIAMQFWGPINHLHTSYSSDPALPPADIISLIAFGKTSEATNATAPGALGAESLIASQVSSQLTSRVEKIAGISQLTVDPVLGGGGQTPGARIAIQQRVTSKIFVTFATDVTSTQREAISVQYQATPRLSFSGTRDENGGFGFDTRIRKAW